MSTIIDNQLAQLEREAARLRTEQALLKQQRDELAKDEHLRKCHAARDELAVLAAQSGEAVERRKREEREASVKAEQAKTEKVCALERAALAQLLATVIGASLDSDPRYWKPVLTGNASNWMQCYGVGATFLADVRYALHKRGLECGVETRHRSFPLKVLAACNPVDKVRTRDRSRLAELELDAAITLEAFQRACAAYDAHWIGVVWPLIEQCIAKALATADPPNNVKAFRTSIACAHVTQLSAQAFSTINEQLATAQLTTEPIRVYSCNDTHLNVELQEKVKARSSYYN